MPDKQVKISVLAEDKFSKSVQTMHKSATELARSIGVIDDEMEQLIGTQLRFYNKATGHTVSPVDVVKLKAANKQFAELEKNAQRAAKSLDKVGDESADAAKGMDKAAKKADKLGKELRDAEKESKGLYGSLKTLRGALTILGIGIGVREVTQFAASSLKFRAQVESIEQSFRNMVSQMGGDADKLLKDMDDMALGTVNRIQLMKSANIALASTGEELTGKLPKLMEIARVAALQTGQAVEHVFATLITGIARGEPRLIDNANIYIKVGQAVEAYAKSLGKASDQLSQEERRIATANAVIAEAPRLLAAAGDQSRSLAVGIASVGVGFVDAKIAFGNYINEILKRADAIPGLNKFLNRTTEILDEQAKALKDQTFIDAYVARGEAEDPVVQYVSKNLAKDAEELSKIEKFLINAELAARGYLEELTGLEHVLTRRNRLEKEGAELLKLVDRNMALAARRSTYYFPGYAYEENMEDLEALEAQAEALAQKRLIEFEIRAKGLASVQDRMNSILLGMTDIWDRDTISAKRHEWVKIINEAYARASRIGGFWADYVIEIALKSFTKQGQIARDALSSQEKALSDSLDNRKRMYDKFASAVEEILTGGLDVTQEDLDAAEAGTYEDKPMEVVKQLRAIAARGQSELDAHPDWEIYIPVGLKGDEAGTMAWAQKTADEMARLVSPEFENLMDLSGGKQRTIDAYAKMIEDEAKKKKNIETAVSWIVGAGYSKEDATNVVNQAFGETPELETALNIKIPDETKMVEGIAKQVEDSDIGAAVFGAMSVSFVKHEDLYVNIGKTVGTYFYTGFTTAISDNSENFQDQLITFLLPGIIAALPTGGGDLP